MNSKLCLIRMGVDLCIGNCARSSATENPVCLSHPMLVQLVNMTKPPTIQGQPPQQVTGYKLLPLPAKEITLCRIDWFGEVEIRSEIYSLYQQVRDAQNKQAEAVIEQ